MVEKRRLFSPLKLGGGTVGFCFLGKVLHNVGEAAWK